MYLYVQELEKVRREKQELHAQFAKEIEAAHAQLSQREMELGTEHLHTLKQLREEHSEGKRDNRVIIYTSH